MYCTHCGIELRSEDCYCSRCGERTAAAAAASPARVLLLDKRNKKIAGVCAGLARYLDADVTLVRVIVLTLALATGIGFIGYLVAWMIIPSDRGMEPAAVVPVETGRTTFAR
jgi:phage shock protein C